VQSAKQTVIFDPPRLCAHEGLQFGAAFGLMAPFRVDETLEGRAQPGAFEPACKRVIDHPAVPDGLEREALVRRERGLAAQCDKFRNGRQMNEEWIDGHGADCRIGGLLARRHLVHRQQLPGAHPAFTKPRRHRRQIGKLPDPPAAGRRAGKQRDDESGAALTHQRSRYWTSWLRTSGSDRRRHSH